MAPISQQEIVEGNTLSHDECKRKVVDDTKTKKSYEFKENPLVKKEALEIEAMR